MEIVEQYGVAEEIIEYGIDEVIGVDVNTGLVGKGALFTTGILAGLGVGGGIGSSGSK